ncbi:MAG: hypothetical protein AAFN59_00670 [Pseudomonadota bacterium]
MGFRISYICADLPVLDLVKGMGLVLSGKANEMPSGDDFWAARLKSDTSLLWCEDELYGFDRQRLLLALSMRTRVVNCIINETVMASTAQCFEGGELVWQLHWQGDEELTREQLTIEGTPPAILEQILKENAEDQAEFEEEEDFEDCFEVPVTLAERLTGFRYDASLERDAVDEFLILLPSSGTPRKAELFSRLFGRPQ